MGPEGTARRSGEQKDWRTTAARDRGCLRICIPEGDRTGERLPSTTDLLNPQTQWLSARGWVLATQRIFDSVER